jgi:cyclopropane-fatty-acyl-phospholipid synthase
MLEAVGKEYIQPYFKMIDDVLNEKGVAVFQVITIPEARFENCQFFCIDDEVSLQYS